MASTGEVWRLGHRPALDGLRGVAVALVVLMHGQVPHLGGAGATGVAVFFTLSGFLITTLLLEENRSRGRVALGRFYQRRAARLLPALVAMVLLTAGVTAAVGAVGFVAPSVMAGSLLYVNNWIFATGAHLRDGLGHTWSLSIEEQFYFAWPLLLLALTRCGRRTQLALVGAAVVGSFALRVALWDSGAGAWRVYFGTDTRADNLLVGCLLALWLHRRTAGVNSRPIAVVGLAAVAVCTQATGFAVFVLVPLVAAVATVAVIAHSVQSGPTLAALKWRPLVWLGRRSYGAYLWHYPVAEALRHTGLAWPVVVAVLVPVTLLLTVASWRYVEEPFLRHRSRRIGSPVRESRPAPTVATPAASGC